MPELPEVETVRRGLAPAMEGARFTRVEQRRGDLRFPFPENFAARLEGRRVDSLGRRKIKGNMDIELAVNAMEMADHVDNIVLFSGDGDFRSLVEAVQRKGVRVSVVSTITTQPPMVADELRRQADEFIDLVQLVNKIGRDPVERTERPRFVERRPVAGAPAPAAPQTVGAGDDQDH